GSGIDLGHLLSPQDDGIVCAMMPLGDRALLGHRLLPPFDDQWFDDQWRYRDIFKVFERERADEQNLASDKPVHMNGVQHLTANPGVQFSRNGSKLHLVGHVAKADKWQRVPQRSTA